MRGCVLAAGLFVAGCGGSAGPPVKLAKQVEQRNDGVPVFPTQPPPAASDSASSATASRISSALTGNDPTLVAKLKTVYVSREGIRHSLPGEVVGDLPVKLEFTAAWPDTCK